jgi:protein TonB
VDVASVTPKTRSAQARSNQPRSSTAPLAIEAPADQVSQPQPQTPAAAPARIESGFGAGSYRPGRGVSWPKDLQQAKPTYTDGAVKAKIEGIVELELVVLPDGTVGPVRITKSLDTQYGLDAEAIRAARQWVFSPSQLNGGPVSVVVPMQLEFRLSRPNSESG